MVTLLVRAGIGTRSQHRCGNDELARLRVRTNVVILADGWVRGRGSVGTRVLVVDRLAIRVQFLLPIPGVPPRNRALLGYPVPPGIPVLLGYPVPRGIPVLHPRGGLTEVRGRAPDRLTTTVGLVRLVTTVGLVRLVGSVATGALAGLLL